MSEVGGGGGDGILSCCVCMVEPDDDAKVYALLDAETGALLSLNEIAADDSIRGGAVNGVAANHIIFASACGEHAICNYCLHHLATSARNHPIGPRHPMIPCPYPFQECLTLVGLHNYFSHTTVERLLMPDEIVQYRAHVARYQFPGFELVACPRPSRFGMLCGAGILVSLEDIRTTPPGRLIMVCDQSSHCHRKTCYSCHALVHRSRDYCEHCVTAAENTNPKLLNYYFYRPDRQPNEPALLLNEEITVDMAISQILDIANAERLEVRCIECHIPMLKAELCNALEHCGTERCYSCGRCGTQSRKLGDHWDSNGVKGCPRFDHSGYWNKVAGCQFQCVEGKCYNEELGDCNVPEHSAGIGAMIHARKRAHIYHAIKSLLPGVRQAVLDKLWIHSPSIRPYMPRYWSSDYRTYAPDTLTALLTAENDDAELASKVATLQFEPIIYPVVVKKKKKASSKPKPRHQILFERFKERYIR